MYALVPIGFIVLLVYAETRARIQYRFLPTMVVFAQFDGRVNDTVNAPELWNPLVLSTTLARLAHAEPFQYCQMIAQFPAPALPWISLRVLNVSSLPKQ